jgi:hypothetical protein
MTHRCIVIPAAAQPNARGLCKGLAGPAGDGMFATGLSATGLPPATHYISAGHISDDMAALLPCKRVIRDPDGIESITTDPGMPDAVPTLAAKVGMPTTATKIKALYSAIDVSDQEPFAAMARLGLKLVQEPL